MSGIWLGFWKKQILFHQDYVILLFICVYPPAIHIPTPTNLFLDNQIDFSSCFE